MNKKITEELKLWRFLANLWGILTLIFFLITFFGWLETEQALKSIAIIYISVLSIFTSIKEFNRWSTKDFPSQHNGELFIVTWTILMLIFILLNTYDCDNFQISTEFTATYLSILGIFAISRKSKYLKKK